MEDFRTLARNSLRRAKVEMATNDSERLRYAALELREAMEALTYDLAAAYKEDIAPEQYKTWQPRKLMDVLLDIDPAIGTPATIAAGEETEYGKPAPAENMKVLGTDTPISLKNIKEHYNALGSYLHIPSLEQVTAGKVPDIGKLRTRCESLVTILGEILASQVWNVTFGNYATLAACLEETCRRPIKRRIPFDKKETEIRCFSCSAHYTLRLADNHKVLWEPKYVMVPCANTTCKKEFPLWPSEVKVGTRWRCPDCNTVHELRLAVATIAADSLTT